MKEKLMDTRIREQRLNQLVSVEETIALPMIDSILYRRNRVQLGYVMSRLGTIEQARAIHAYYIDHDLNACKRKCYLASKLILASVGLDGGPSFETANHILYALLSDNLDVINAMAHVETPLLIQERENPTVRPFYVHMLQLAMRGDDDYLWRLIELGSKKGNKKRREEFRDGRDFFSLLLNRDQAALEDLLQTQHARIKNSDAVTEDFIAFTATVEAKLCWHRGIPVQIDHPLVPMALMPVCPLSNYDDVYDFLKPGWVPPPQGFFANLVRRMAGA